MAGPVSIIGWVFTGVGAMLLALVFARLGRTFPRTGGPYAYSRRAFGDFIGFQTAWGYWIAAWAGNAAIAVAFVGYLAVFWGDLEIEQPARSARRASRVIWLLTFVNIAGARETGAVQVVTTVLKFVPLAIIGVVGLFFIDSDNLTPFAPEGTWSAISAAAPLTLWAFIGLESATVAAGEVKDPERTIPRATDDRHARRDGGLHPHDGRGHGRRAAGRAGRVLEPVRARRRRDVRRRLGQGHRAGRHGRHLRRTERLDHAPGAGAARGRRGRPVPRTRSPSVHGERKTPVFGLVVSSVLVSGLMLMNYTKGLVDAFTFIILLATLTTLVPYAYSAAAQAHLYLTEPELFDRRDFVRDVRSRRSRSPTRVWAITGSGKDIIAKGFVLLLAGIPIYVAMKWWQARQTPVIALAPSRPPPAPSSSWPGARDERAPATPATRGPAARRLGGRRASGA